MAFTVGDAIENARDRNRAFGPEAQPQPLARRHCLLLVRALVVKTAGVRAQALPTVETEVALPMADFAAGVALPATTYRVRDVSAAQTAGGRPRPVTLLPDGHRLTARRFPAVFTQTGSDRLTYLRLAGTEAQWGSYAGLTVRSVTIPAHDGDGGEDADVVPLPDLALDAVAAGIAAAFALRADPTQVSADRYAAASSEATDQYLLALAYQGAGEALRIQRVR